MTKRQYHGLSKTTPLYDVWCGMKARCYNKNHVSFPWYGALGIGVCSAWKDNFQNFYDWATNNGYEKGLCIARKNPRRKYSPSNCRFATQSENNKESPATIIYNGENCTEASHRLGGGDDLVAGRIRQGFTIADAFTLPKGYLRKKGIVRKPSVKHAAELSPTLELQE